MKNPHLPQFFLVQMRRVFFEEIGTGMILLKKQSKKLFTIFKTLPPSCNEDVNFKYKFNGLHDPCEITQINITQ